MHDDDRFVQGNQVTRDAGKIHGTAAADFQDNNGCTSRQPLGSGRQPGSAGYGSEQTE